jgi:hypothetical protein
VSIRDEFGISPTHDVERLPVKFRLAGRTFEIHPPNVRRANAWLVELQDNPKGALIQNIIKDIQDASKLRADGSEDASTALIEEAGRGAQRAMGEMMDLCYSLAGWAEGSDERAFIEEHAGEAEILQLFMGCYLLGNRLRTQAQMIAAAVSESPKSSAASVKPNGEAKTKRPSRKSTTT